MQDCIYYMALNLYFIGDFAVKFHLVKDIIA